MADSRIQVLDHGYVEVVEQWGSDERIIEAARMSTGKGFLGWQQCQRCSRFDPPQGDCVQHSAGLHDFIPADSKFLRFLWENKHATPFEMAGATFEVKAPIFVFREWHRHRTQSYNEMSARYTPLPDENYVPTIERLLANSKTNKQAARVDGAKELTEGDAVFYRETLKTQYANAEDFYQTALRAGVPKELARVHLPVGRYSRMRASTDLRNWLGFLSLRMPLNAQWEIRQYAGAVHDVLARLFPRTLGLFQEGLSRG